MKKCCVICGKYWNFKKPKSSCILGKTGAKMKMKTKFREKESIEVFKILGVFENI